MRQGLLTEQAEAAVFSDFILWDMKKDAWVEPIRHALVPAKR